MFIVCTHGTKAPRKEYVIVLNHTMTDRVPGGLECIKSHTIAKYLVDGTVKYQWSIAVSAPSALPCDHSERDAKVSFHGPHYVLLTMNILAMVYYIFDKL